MSSTNPTTTLADTGTSTPTSTSSHTQSNTATLYLLFTSSTMDSTSFTFLATILILVLLSASLVLRSYILRRRYRQRFQQALADGLFVDLDRGMLNGAGQFDTLGGFRRSTRRLGPKPVVWDTWLHPADKNTWPSITPVAVRCTPFLSPPSTLTSPQPFTAPPGSPQAQSRSSLFSQLRIPSPFSLSPRSSSPLPGQAHTPIGTPASASTRSPPPGVSTSPEDAATLAVCVLVAMPDASAPVHRPLSDAKGKGVDPLESQAHDADPLLSSPHRSARAPDLTNDEGIPLLEFGVVEMGTGEWVWKS